MSLPDPTGPDPAAPNPNPTSPGPLDPEPQLLTRRSPTDHESPATPRNRRLRRALLLLPILAVTLLLLAVVGYFSAQFWIRHSTRAALPQLDGTLSLPGLAAPVTVTRDPHGVPHIQAASVDDLVLAQAFLTSSDRLFQMDLLRRHAAGELAAIFGPSMLPHDRLQRTLQIRAAADRTLIHLPPAQLHLLEVYSRGVNASIAAQTPHLPIEFRLLHYTPAPWTPRDSLLVSLAMFQDLTNTFQSKLTRESLSARLPPDLVPDLFPVGSWRDHPPDQPIPDLTIPGPPIAQVPLDESQASLHLPTTTPPADSCPSCFPGSNNWVVSGAHTASGKPLLSNDMHLTLSVPGTWYEANLEAAQPGSPEPLHVSGLSLPGIPLIVVGQNAHVAWGFTNLGADVQDVYIEPTRNPGPHAEFQSSDGAWQPILHFPEHIEVRGSKDEILDVTATRHADAITPILTPLLKKEARTLSLRWTLYDPDVLEIPSLELASARDWPTFLAALAHFGGPAQNVVYADDAGHIGFHAAGRIPLRGPARDPALAEPIPSDILAPDASSAVAATPTISATSPELPTPLSAPAPGPRILLSGPLSPVPIVPSAAIEWSGYIPFDKLPQVFDPPGGVIATANSRTVPDDYAYPITLNWAAPYRNERIWHLLAHRTGLTPADMLAIQSDVYSDFEHVLAQRLAYAVDHSALVHNSKPSDRTQLLQAADLLRTFNGQMTADSPAAAIISSAHHVLWRILLERGPAPRLDPANPRQVKAANKTAEDLTSLYNWGESDYALEQIIMHTPPRWLPPNFASWDDLLAAALDLGLHEAHAPADLTRWRFGAIHTVDLEHPLFSQSPTLQRLLGLPTGTGPRPQSGDPTTVKQVGHTFGPSERFTADLANPDNSTLNIVLGQSGNPASPWYMDQFPTWYHVSTNPFPFNTPAQTHTLTLTPAGAR